MKKQFFSKGFTAVELLIVIVIMGIFLVAVSLQISRWARRYSIERDIRQMHIDLLYAKKIAMDRNISQFFRVNAANKNDYEVVEDRNRNDTLDATDCQAGNDCTILRYTSKYNISWSNSNELSFDHRGIASDNNTFCIFSSVSPQFDCIVISNTRINIGKLKIQGVCNANNCNQK